MVRPRRWPRQFVGVGRVVVRIEGLGGLAGGDAMTLGDQVREQPAPDPCLADLGSGSGHHDDSFGAGEGVDIVITHRHVVYPSSGRSPIETDPSSSSASTSWSTSPRCGGRQGDPEPAGPLGHGRGANGGDQEASIDERLGHFERPGSVAQHHRHDRARGGRGRNRSTLRPQLRHERVALGRRDDADGGGGGRHVGRGRRGGEDERPGPLMQRSMTAGDRPRTHRATRGSSTACPSQHHPEVGTRARDRMSGPSTAWASSSTTSASWRPADTSHQGVDIGRVAVHRERPSPTPPVRGPGRPVARAGPRPGPRSEWGNTIDRARARRTPSMIEAWFSSSLRITVHVGAAAASRQHTEVGGEPGGEQQGRRRFPSRPRAAASSSSCAGRREPTISRDAPEPVPHRSMRRVRGGDDGRDVGTGRGSRSTRRDDHGARRRSRCGPTRRSTTSHRAPATGGPGGVSSGSRPSSRRHGPTAQASPAPVTRPAPGWSPRRSPRPAVARCGRPRRRWW